MTCVFHSGKEIGKMGFDLDIGRDEAIYDTLGTIARRYFTIDTAPPDTAYTWYRKNPYCVITARINGVVHGYADFLPLTSEARQLLETGRLQEDDITPDHLLDAEALPYCKAVYFSGIAIRDKGTVLGARCAAALVAGSCRMIQTIYRQSPLEFIYANPTTFAGNRLARRTGFEPVVREKRMIGGMDLYKIAVDDAYRANMEHIYAQYSPLIASVGWENTGKDTGEAA